MEPLSTIAVGVLIKYALEKVEPKAIDFAREMWTGVWDRLSGSDGGRHVATEFKNDPNTYEKPMEKAIEKLISEDAEFRNHLQALVDQYRVAAGIHDERRVVTASNGGIAIGGRVSGSTIIAGQHVDAANGHGRPK